ncbi:MAG: DUF1707 SHOCT-like domain-containing protein [Streptosporangiaceae bacterium]
MAGPGGEIAAGAAGRGRMRASHTDREQVIGVLKAAFVQGRLDRDEFGLRVGQVLTSRTYTELAVLTADLPAGLTTAQPPKTARESANKKAVKAVACGTAAFTSVVAAAAAATGGSIGQRLALVAVFVPFVAMLGAAMGLFHAWLDRRAGRQSSRGLPPGRGGQAFQRSVPADSAGHLPQVDRDLRHPAEAARSHPPRPSLSSRWPPHRWRLLGQRYAIGCPGH